MAHDLERLKIQLELKVDQLEKSILAADEEYARIQAEALLLEEACNVLVRLASEQQAAVLTFLSDTVSAGLSDVFGKPMRVEFREDVRASQRVVDVVLIIGDLECDIPDSVGGGVTQVVSVLTRLVLVYLLRGRRAQFVVLDESLSHLADVYVPAMAEVLYQLSSRLGIQLLLVTHQPDFLEVADVTVELVQGDDGAEMRS
jgi:DNA repair exonuclease SbcCD ATPase subunit